MSYVGTPPPQLQLPLPFLTSLLAIACFKPLSQSEYSFIFLRSWLLPMFPPTEQVRPRPHFNVPEAALIRESRCSQAGPVAGATSRCAETPICPSGRVGNGHQRGGGRAGEVQQGNWAAPSRPDQFTDLLSIRATRPSASTHKTMETSPTENGRPMRLRLLWSAISVGSAVLRGAVEVLY